MKRKIDVNSIDYAKAFIDEMYDIKYCEYNKWMWLGYINNYELFLIAKDDDIMLYCTYESLKIKDIKKHEWYEIDTKDDIVENYKKVRSLAFDIAKSRFVEDERKNKFEFYEDKNGQLCLICN